MNSNETNDVNENCAVKAPLFASGFTSASKMTSLVLVVLVFVTAGNLYVLLRLSEEIQNIKHQFNGTRVVDSSPTASSDLFVVDKAMRHSYSDLTNLVMTIGEKGTAQDTADVLIEMGGWLFPEEDTIGVEQIESQLTQRLRKMVKDETKTLQLAALRSDSYRAGHESLRKAESVLALYPLSDKADVLKEAEAISLMQRNIAGRLDLIRRQRYNSWAAKQVETALRDLRKDSDHGSSKAIAQLQPIDPSFLEPSVASIYSYAVEEMMKDLKQEKKALIAKDLTNPSVTRRTLGDF